jgi:hypothetical protein
VTGFEGQNEKMEVMAAAVWTAERTIVVLYLYNTISH